MRATASGVVAVVLVLVQVAPYGATPPAYRVPQMLGTLNEAWANTVAVAVNDRGDVVGHGQTAGGLYQPYIWTREGGFQTILDPLEGSVPDINNHGEVIGSYFPPGAQTRHGFLWRGQKEVVDLGEFWPMSINNRGQIAGGCDSNTSRQYPCVWANGATFALPVADRSGVAARINQHGDVAGVTMKAAVPSEEWPFDDIPVPFLWRHAGGVRELPLPEGIRLHHLSVTGLTDDGRVVAWPTIDGDQADRIFMWDAEGTLQSSPDVWAFPLGINNDGVVVGRDMRGQGHAFAWRVGGPLTRLPAFPGETSSFAVDINARGDVVGSINMEAADVVRPGDGAYAAMWRRPDSLHILTPNDPSRWGIGTRQRLAWSYDGDAPQFQIDISRDGGRLWDFLEMVPNKAGRSQNFEWTVTGGNTSAARFRVTAIGDEHARDVNDVDIRIAPAAMQVAAPTRRSVVRVGARLAISWKHNLGARKPVAIDVSTDGGSSWRSVTARTATKGTDTSSFTWTVDVMPTSRGRLRIRALGGSGTTALSQVFTVKAP
jgi:uncharacterized membrane protein